MKESVILLKEKRLVGLSNVASTERCALPLFFYPFINHTHNRRQYKRKNNRGYYSRYNSYKQPAPHHGRGVIAVNNAVKLDNKRIYRRYNNRTYRNFGDKRQRLHTALKRNKQKPHTNAAYAGRQYPQRRCRGNPVGDKLG